MDNEQIQSLISQLKAVGLEDEQIMDVFYEAFTKGKMDRKDLETLAESLGYELDDDFKNEPTPDPIAAEGESNDEPAAGTDAEDLKEIKPGESVEEFKDKIEEAKEDGEGEVEEKEEEKEESHDDEEDTDEGEKEEEDKEWDEANKYFKI